MTKLQAGDRAPGGTAVDDHGDEASLDDLGKGKLVVYFYPKAFTPGCTTEACDFRDRRQRFTAAGYDIVGVSPDAPDRLAAFREEHGLPFRLLSDPDHAIADAFGAWGTKTNYGKEYEGIIRSTFVVEDGVVRDAWYNVKATGHADRVVESVGR